MPAPHDPHTLPACTAVIFDLGQVVVRWDPAAAFAPELAPGEAHELLARMGFHGHNHRLDAGEDFEQVRADVAAIDPEHARVFEHYHRNKERAVIGPVPGTAEIVADLKAAGVHVYGLTNWAATDYHLAGQAAPAVRELEGVVVSGEEKIAKPDERIFRIALERFGLQAPQTLFVDDTLPNIEAAAALGFQVHHFITAPALRAELEARGMLPAATPAAQEG